MDPDLFEELFDGIADASTGDYRVNFTIIIALIVIIIAVYYFTNGSGS